MCAKVINVVGISAIVPPNPFKKCISNSPEVMHNRIPALLNFVHSSYLLTFDVSNFRQEQ